MRRPSLVLLTMIASARLLAAQCPDGSPPPCGGARGPVVRPVDPHGVAVLYFASQAGDSTGLAIADGLTEEMIARLSQVPGLHPASRFASLRYRGRRIVDPKQVSRELAARYVLDGSVRRSANRLRVVLTMTDASAGFNVWGQTYERPIEDIFSIEDSVAVHVAEAALGTLATTDRARLTPATSSTNVEAYQAFLRGRVAIRVRTAAAASAAVAAYRRALVLDPGFTRAWAGLAHALALSRDWGWKLRGIPSDSVQPLAEAAAARALALDSSDADAWLASAMAMRGHDLVRALQLHQRAWAMDSTNVEAIHQLAWGFLASGQLDSAITWERRAILRDPFYAYAYAGLAEMLNISGAPDDALRVIEQGVAVDSSNAPLYWQRADAQARLGHVREAQQAVERAESLGFDSLGIRLFRLIAQVRAGDTASARAALPRLEADVAAAPPPPGGWAYSTAAAFSGLHAQLGDVDGALAYAERIPDYARRFYVMSFERHWFWSPVRGDPRFRAFLATLR